jgi:FKBP-type peptidyl-prolyl cis-trans isomerase
MKKGIAGLLLLGVICIAACHKSVVTPTVYQQFTTDSTLIVNYLADNHINATLHDSIWYMLSETGTGPTPTRFNCVLIKYSAYELDALLPGGTGTPFQQNVNPGGLKGPLKNLGEPTTGVFISVSGLQIALKKFPVGTKARVYLPSYMAYGTTGQTDISGAYVVHPNKCVVFDIELIQLSDYNVAGNYCYE